MVISQCDWLERMGREVYCVVWVRSSYTLGKLDRSKYDGRSN